MSLSLPKKVLTSAYLLTICGAWSHYTGIGLVHGSSRSPVETAMDGSTAHVFGLCEPTDRGGDEPEVLEAEAKG